MPDYHKLILRHGEHGMQALVERMERYEGITGRQLHLLEDRWNALMEAAVNKEAMSTVSEQVA